MSNQDPRALPPAAGDSTSRASLQIELRAHERQTVIVFRDLLLRWLTDPSTPLSQSFGPANRLFVDEPAAATDAEPALRLSAGWPSAPEAPAAAAKPGQAREFVFFPDPPEAMPALFHKLPMLRETEPDHVAPSARRRRLGTPAHMALVRQALDTLRSSSSRARDFAREAAADLRGLPVGGIATRKAAFASGVMALTVLLLAGAISVWSSGGGTSDAAVASASTRTIAARQSQSASPGISMAAASTSEREAKPVATSLRVPPPNQRTAAGASAGSEALLTAVDERPATPARPLPETSVAKETDRELPAAHRASPRHISGGLVVRSEPKGAQVSINGVVHGRTPLVIRGLDAGSRVVRLDLPGYERWSWAVGVVANRQTPVTVKLQPEHNAGTD